MEGVVEGVDDWACVLRTPSVDAQSLHLYRQLRARLAPRRVLILTTFPTPRGVLAVRATDAFTHPAIAAGAEALVVHELHPDVSVDAATALAFITRCAPQSVGAWVITCKAHDTPLLIYGARN